MNCTKCGQWNPDDKRVCWRCDAELPKPVEKQPKRTTAFMGLPLWSWVLIIVLFILLVAGQCIAPMLAS